MCRRGVGQDGEADDLQAVAVAQSSLVDEHAFAKVTFGIALNLDMDEHGDPATVAGAHQFVGVAPTARAAGADLLQFLVEKLRRYAPVDPGVDGRELWFGGISQGNSVSCPRNSSFFRSGGYGSVKYRGF